MRALGEWSPDVFDVGTDVLDVARNVYPKINSYGPVKSLTAVSDELGAVCKGLWEVRKSGGESDTYAATKTKLWKYNPDGPVYLLDANGDNVIDANGDFVVSISAWTDVSRTSGGAYACGDDDMWSGALYGTKFILVNPNDDPQVIDVDSGTAFAALAGSPPRGRFVTVMDNCVVISQLASNPRMIHWSDRFDHENWSTVLSDTAEFPDHGAVMGTFPHAEMVLLERGSRRIVMTRSVPLFDFLELDVDKGSIAPYSPVEFGNSLFWVGEDAIYVGNAGGHQPISHNRFGVYFFDKLNRSRIHQVHGTVDPFAPRIYLSAPSEDTDYNNFILGWDFSLNKPFEIEVDHYILSRSATASVSLDSIGPDSDDMDEAGLPSLDSRIYMGGSPVIAAIDVDQNLAFLDGDNLEAFLETGNQQFGSGRRAKLSAVRLYVEGEDGEDATLRVGKRQRLSDDIVWHGPHIMQASGKYRTHTDAFFHKLEITIPAGSVWTAIHGFDPEFAETGER